MHHNWHPSQIISFFPLNFFSLSLVTMSKKLITLKWNHCYKREWSSDLLDTSNNYFHVNSTVLFPTANIDAWKPRHLFGECRFRGIRLIGHTSFRHLNEVEVLAYMEKKSLIISSLYSRLTSDFRVRLFALCHWYYH